MAPEPLKILLLQDESEVRGALAAQLQRDGYQVLQARTYVQAIELARANPVQAFLLELDLPDSNGIEVCKTIRRMEPYRVTPVLFVTQATEDARLSDAFAAGGDDFIQKPLNPVLLRARLQSHLRRMEYFTSLQRTREMLERYVSRRTLEIVEMASRTGHIPGPQERDVVICFTDIRGFTAMSEEMDPATLFPAISAVLADQVRLVHEAGGYIDKFGGDGLMAVFDGPDRVRQSCQCALRIIEKAGLQTEYSAIGQMGIGINSGRATIGNIGSPEHLDYSVIGSTVNLAARLCGHAQPMSIIVSKAVRDVACADPSFAFHSERQVPIRGFRRPITVYELNRTQSMK
jgi:class 3 adenylate cyclase